MGTDIKQKIIDSLKSTWTSINNFARAHQSDSSESLEQQVESEMSQISRQLEDDDRSDTACKWEVLSSHLIMKKKCHGFDLSFSLDNKCSSVIENHVRLTPGRSIEKHIQLCPG